MGGSTEPLDWGRRGWRRKGRDVSLFSEGFDGDGGGGALEDGLGEGGLMGEGIEEEGREDLEGGGDGGLRLGHYP